MADWTLASFMELVARCRYMQRRYYRHRRHLRMDERSELLTAALDLEHEVDRAIEEIRRGPTLFDGMDPEL